MRIDSKKPFKSSPEDPAPLSRSVERRVHFGECDPMGVLWHGHYASYFSEAREALGRACGIDYEDLKKAGIGLPIKTMFLDYSIPLLYGQVYTVEASLHWSEAARLNIAYRILDREGLVATTGFTVQLMVNEAGEFYPFPPPFYQAFLDGWAAGRLAAIQR